MNIIALRLKGCRAKPSMISIPFFHKVSISCIRGSRKTSISIPGCLVPYISMDSERYSLLAQQCRHVVIINITGHVLWHHTDSFHSYSMQTKHFLGPFQILDNTSHQNSSTGEHYLDVEAFNPSCTCLNPTIISVHHPLDSRRNASGN